jgi:hypothetical protein
VCAARALADFNRFTTVASGWSSPSAISQCAWSGINTQARMTDRVERLTVSKLREAAQAASKSRNAGIRDRVVEVMW